MSPFFFYRLQFGCIHWWLWRWWVGSWWRARVHNREACVRGEEIHLLSRENCTWRSRNWTRPGRKWCCEVRLYTWSVPKYSCDHSWIASATEYKYASICVSSWSKTWSTTQVECGWRSGSSSLCRGGQGFIKLWFSEVSANTHRLSGLTYIFCRIIFSIFFFVEVNAVINDLWSSTLSQPNQLPLHL